jgi:hypothetical protein
LSIIEVVTLKEKLFFQIKILFMFYINWKNKWKSFYRSNALIQKVRKNFLRNISNDDFFNRRTRETNLKFIILLLLKLFNRSFEWI